MQKQYTRNQFKRITATFLLISLWCFQQRTLKSEEIVFDLPETLPYPEYVERTIIGFPQQLYWGDIFYLKVVQKNVTDTPFVVYDAPLADPFSRRNVFVSVSSDVTDERFNYYPAGIYDPNVSFNASEKIICPGHSVTVCYPLEIPSQEAILHPFWTAIEKNLGPEGIQCKLTVMLTDNFVRFPERYTQIYPYNTNIHYTSHEILIKPRPEKEMLLLQKWQETNPPYKLAVSRKFESKQDTVWYTDCLHFYDSNRQRLKNDDICVSFNGQEVSLFEILRLTNSRPPIMLCPNTPEKWRKLEEFFIPSTLRDEIQWVRMQMDYYCAEDSDRPIRKMELIDWISSLPKSQQTAYVSGIGNEFYRIYLNIKGKNNEYEEMKNDLMRPFYDIMTTEIQLQLHAGLSDMQHPWGDKQDIAPYVFYEFLEPPERYLNLRKENKTDENGFRFWKFGIYYFKAEYVRKTDQGNIVLRDRFGTNVHIPRNIFEKYDLTFIDEINP